MATSPPSSMDSVFQGMPEETVLFALKVAQFMEGKSKQDLEAMIEKFDQTKPTNINDEQRNDSNELLVIEDENSPKMGDNLNQIKDEFKEVDSANLISESKAGLVNGTANANLENEDITRLNTENNGTNKEDIVPEEVIENGEKLSSSAEKGEANQNFASNDENSSDNVEDDLNGKMLAQTADHKRFSDGNDDDVSAASSDDDDMLPSTPASGVESSISEMSVSPSERSHVMQNFQGTQGLTSTKNIPESSSSISESHEPQQAGSTHFASHSAEDKFKNFSNRPVEKIQDAPQVMNKDDKSPLIIPTHLMSKKDQIKTVTRDVGNHNSTESVSKTSRVIMLDPESHRVNYKSYSTSPKEHKPKDLSYIPTTAKYHGSHVHGSSSTRTPQQDQYEEFPSLPAEVKDQPTQSNHDDTTMSGHSTRQKETQQEYSPIVTSSGKMTSTSSTEQGMSNAILAANTALPSIPLYYQPHIVMKDNLPVLMLKPVWAPNLSSELSQSINLNGNTMLFPLSKADGSSMQVNYVTSFDTEKANEKSNGEQVVEHPRESDTEKKSPTEKNGQQDWPTGTSVSVNEEKTPLPTNPFLEDNSDSSSDLRSSPSAKMSSNFGFPLPGTEYLTGPSSNPFNPDVSPSKSSREDLSRTDFKTIPKSMLANQIQPMGTTVSQSSSITKAPRGPLVSGSSMSPKGPHVGHTVGNTAPSSGLPVFQQRAVQPHMNHDFHPKGPPVSHQGVNSQTPREPPISQASGFVSQPREPPISQASGFVSQPREPPISQASGIASQPREPPISQASGIASQPREPPVSQASGIASQPREPPVSQASGIASQPRGPHVSQSDNTTQPWHTPVGQTSNGDSQPRRRLSSGSMVTLLEVTDNQPKNVGQTTDYTGRISPAKQPSLPSTSLNFTRAQMTSSAPSSIPSTRSNFTSAHVTSSTVHDISGATADPCAVVNVVNTNSQPETKPKMPGHVAPYWVPDDQVFKCAYCHLKFTFIRRKHHCRGCGKIFCNDCCSQLARLSYLQYQIGRICIICTNMIKDSKKNKKKPTQTRSPQLNKNSPIKQPSTVTNHPQPQSDAAPRNQSVQSSVLNPVPSPMNSETSSPQNKTQLVFVPPGYGPPYEHPPSTVAVGDGAPLTQTGGDTVNPPTQSVPPFQPLIMARQHAVAITTPAHQANRTMTSHSISQSERSALQTVQKDANTSCGNSTESSRNMNLNPAGRQEKGDYSEYKLPVRPAGRIVSWNGQSFASRLLAQDRRKALARDLRELPHGVTMQLSDELKVIVRKIKVQSSPVVHAWSCHSTGLKDFNQQEIAMHFKIKPKEDVVPEEILRMYKVILDLVKLGSIFHHSNFLAFKSPFLGTSDNAALIFASSSLVRQPPKAFGESRPDRLYAILVKRSELEYAQYTPTRFLLRLGQEYKSFPFPLLNVRDRPSVYDGVDPGDTIYNTSVALNNHLKNTLPEALIPGLTVLQEDSKVVLQIPVESQTTVLNFFDRLIVKTTQTATIPLVSDLTTNVDQYRVYHQSIQTDEISLRKHMSLFRNPMNPTHHGVRSVTGLGFLLLLLGDNDSPVLEQRGKLVDDGAIVQLSDVHTQRLRQCLHDRDNCHFYLGDQFEMMYFELRWLQESLFQQTSEETLSKSTPQEPQIEYYPGTATIDVRHSGQPSELKKMADARLGDVLILARLLEQRIKQASTEALMMQANRMKAGETKELVLKLSLQNGRTKWSIGPANQPMSLIRSLQMALYDVRLSDLRNASLDLSFDVTIIKQFDLIAEQIEKDL